MGDLNARVGRRNLEVEPEFGDEHSNTVGPWSLKGDIVPNANGSLLLDIAGENNYRHLPSHFKCRDSKRWTWKHPRYHTRAVLDHIFVPAPHLRYVNRYFVVHQIAIHTDHRLAACELSFCPRIDNCKQKRPPNIDKNALRDANIQAAFQDQVTGLLGQSDPNAVTTDELSAKIRSATVSAAESVLPVKAKTKFPDEFSANTIDMIRRKRKMWKYLQKAGQRVTRSMRETFRRLCRDLKRSVSLDRTASLEREAKELSDAFKENRFKGYKLLKQQHRLRTSAIMPPESEFTQHYRSHYQLGPEEPLVVHGCSPAPLESDDRLSRKEFDEGLQQLNENRAPGHDNCAPEYLKRGGISLQAWLYVLMVRIWTFVSDIPVIDRIGSLIPIPKKACSTSIDTTRPICLLTSIYKLYAILVFRKTRDRIKEYVTWTQAGFMRGRSCANNLWILRRVAERAIEFNVPV